MSACNEKDKGQKLVHKDALDLLLTRRSVKAKNLQCPAPDAKALETILTAAARVPDHGKVVPFYFIVFQGTALSEAADIVEKAYMKAHPDAGQDKILKERARFEDAPMIVAIIMRKRESKNPLWEQVLSVGAVAQNFLLASEALGYGAQWLSEWPAYDENVYAGLGLDERDIIAGFIHVGTPDIIMEERDRPDLSLIVNYFEGQQILKKGDDAYGRKKFNIPELGVDLN